MGVRIIDEIHTRGAVQVSKPSGLSSKMCHPRPYTHRTQDQGTICKVGQSYEIFNPTLSFVNLSTQWSPIGPVCHQQNL